MFPAFPTNRILSDWFFLNIGGIINGRPLAFTISCSQFPGLQVGISKQKAFGLKNLFVAQLDYFCSVV